MKPMKKYIALAIACAALAEHCKKLSLPELKGDVIESDTA